MALVGTAAIAPKFDVRQRQVESRYLGRREAALERQRRAAGLPEVDLAAAARNQTEVAPDRIVPLWTLMAAAAAATAGSLVMLVRERRHDGRRA